MTLDIEFHSPARHLPRTTRPAAPAAERHMEHFYHGRELYWPALP